MRIIAGQYRGKKLSSLGGAEIRPTGDRVKESVFQILSNRLYASRVLDLFCGSGALGIECLSRGAREVVFNDISGESLAVAQKNLNAVGVKCKLFNLGFETCLVRLTGQFDLIFCDPPYKEDYCKTILDTVARQNLLKKDGLVVYESEREEEPAEGWKKADFRKYGRCKVAFFARENLQ